MTCPRPFRERRSSFAFLGDVRGLAATEFALVLPLLITMYFGVFELTRMIDNSRKVSLYARSVADLTGQLPGPIGDKPAAITEADVNAILDGASVILSPFDAGAVQVVVSTLGVEQIRGTLTGRICSSYARNATKRPKNQVSGTNGLPATPNAYAVDGARYLLAEVSMSYSPVIGTNLFKMIFGDNGLVFSRQIPWAERNGEVVLPPETDLCPTR